MSSAAFFIVTKLTGRNRKLIAQLQNMKTYDNFLFDHFGNTLRKGLFPSGRWARSKEWQSIPAVTGSITSPLTGFGLCSALARLGVEPSLICAIALHPTQRADKAYRFSSVLLQPRCITGCRAIANPLRGGHGIHWFLFVKDQRCFDSVNTLCTY